MQHPVLPVRRGRHQFLPERNAGLGQPLAGEIDVGDTELPGQDVIWAAAVEPVPAFDAELD